MQHLSSRLTTQARLVAGVHADLPEHSRGTHGAVGDALIVRDYADAFMDDNSEAEVVSDGAVEALSGQPGPYQIALREVMAEWGITLTAHKGVERMVAAVSRGARVDGRHGCAAPSVWTRSSSCSA